MVRERVEELRRQLEYHNHKYYVENDPSISDFEFDALMRELQQLEEAHPEFADLDSPTVRVGSDISSEFATVRHRYPMLSLGNTYSLDELHEFLARIGREFGRDVAAHAHGRRIGIGILGMQPLQLQQFAHHGVELVIGNHRSVLDIILVAMIFELPAQLFDLVANHKNAL